jgi:hypothetical protein
VDLRSIGKERVGRIKTPTMPASGSAVGYGVVATPRLYSGQTVQFCGRAAAITGGTTNVRAFVRHRVPAEEGQRNWQKLASLSYVERASAPIVLRAGEPFVLSFELPDTGGFPIEDLGLEFRSDTLASGTVYLESCSLSGAPELEYDLGSCSVTKEGPWSGTIDGFVSTMDFHDWHTNVPEWRGRAVAVGSNRGTGLLVTGNRFWRDYRVSAELSLVLADAGGIVLRYQGLERYLAVLQTREELVLVERFYDETVLTRVSSGVELNQPFTLEALCAGGRITVMKNGASVLEAETTHLLDGGAGLIARRGAMSAKRLVIAGS